MQVHTVNQHHPSCEIYRAETPYPGADTHWCKRKRCVYMEYAFSRPVCCYILHTGHPRPCPAGPGCTVLKPGKKIKKSEEDDNSFVLFREK